MLALQPSSWSFPSLNLLVISISFAFIHNSAVANNVIVDAGKSANTTVSKNGEVKVAV